MPGEDNSAYLENDGPLPALPFYNYGDPVAFDPNPFFGIVAYTHAGELDQPLGIVRLYYAEKWNLDATDSTYTRYDPYTVSPLWNERGQATDGFFANGAPVNCPTVTRCVKLQWPAGWFAYSRPRFRAKSWHGTLVMDKQDYSGTHYRRNRYYDPQTGRFTQEDPVGLVGGANLYGFAGADPVNFSDPFGLCPPDDTNESDCGSAYYARRIASGQGNRLVNEIAGAINACNESTVCGIGMWGILGGGLSRLGVSVGLSTVEVGGGGEALSGAERAMQRQFESSGRSSLEKTIKKLTGRIATHEADIAKYREAGGHVSSMEREISGWKETIEAAKRILEKNQ
jgi:RHS repeat-associated protein